MYTTAPTLTKNNSLVHLLDILHYICNLSALEVAVNNPQIYRNYTLQYAKRAEERVGNSYKR